MLVPLSQNQVVRGIRLNSLTRPDAGAKLALFLLEMILSESLFAISIHVFATSFHSGLSLIVVPDYFLLGYVADYHAR